MHAEDFFTLGRSISVRIFFNMCILICAVFLPWWISAIAVAIGLLLFKTYIESVAWAVLIESIYRYADHFPVVLVVTIALFVFFSFIRSRLVFVRNERYTL